MERPLGNMNLNLGKYFKNLTPTINSVSPPTDLVSFGRSSISPPLATNPSQTQSCV
jgi:hypothetical protein